MLEVMRLLILTLCSLLATVVAQSGTLKCGGSWQQLNDKCFVLVAGSNKAWSSAREDCQTRSGGDLAIIPDQATNSFLETMLSGVTTTYWVGLHDIPSESTFRWIDDDTPTDKGYTNWLPGQPNNGFWFIGNQDCAIIDPSDGKWSDESCTDSKPYICERNVTSIPKCDESNGWRGYNGKCYQFFYDSQTWQTAEDTCKFYPGGHLVYIKSPEDQDFLNNLQVTHSNAYWIGLQDKDGISQGGEFQWSDQTAYDLTNDFNQWANNQPSHNWFGNGGDCGRVDSGGLWTISRCTSSFDYVCEIPEGACAPGWYLLGGKCFQLNSQVPKTWTDAKVFCEAQQAYLTSISSDAENNLMKSFLANLNGQGIDELYFGISDLENDGTFVWADGSTSTYTHWRPGEPPQTADTQKDCGYINTGDTVDAYWQTGDCYRLAAFVCEAPVGAQIEPVPTIPITDHCDGPGWDLHKGFCYDVVATKEKWADADTACNALNAELVSIHDDDVQSFMSIRINAVKQRVWIGLNDVGNTGTLGWSDGTATDYYNWAANPGSDNCVTMEAGTTNYGLWTKRSCDLTNYYVCKKAAISGPGPSTAPPPTVNYLSRCGTGWEYDKKSDKCFLFRPFDYVNWFEARHKCRVEGGDLMSIVGNDDLAYATSRLMTTGGGETWIGCNDLGREGGWVWSDKKPFVMINWASGQPDNWQDYTYTGEHCCNIYNNLGTWNDQYCGNYIGYTCNKDDTIFKNFIAYTEKKLNFAVDLVLNNIWPSDCAKRCLVETSFYCLSFDYERATMTCSLRKEDKNTAGGLIPTFDTQHFDHYERDLFAPVPVQSTPNPGNKGCPSGWTEYHNFCYYANFNKLDFAGAEAECQNLGGELASILDVNVNNFLRAFAYEQNKNETRFWIGLTDRNQEMLYEWSNGEPVTFTNWNAHEPNDYNGEDCAELHIDIGFWNDMPCTGYQFNSLCRQPISVGNLPPTPDPTCPAQWKAWNDRCYQITTFPATWADASTNCGNEPNAQLVVIETSIEMAFLSGALGVETIHDYFIALSDSNVPGYYEWLDGTPITYTNWAEGQPDDRQGHCVTVNSAKEAGYWTDRDCTQTYNFICEKARAGYPTILPPTANPGTTPSSQDCATGWVGYGSRCFNIFEFDNDGDAVGWDEANRRCRKMGAELASFHHPDEESFLVGQFSPTTTRKFWIGLNDQRHEGGYAWSDGTQVEYTNWNSGEPNDYGGYEECVETDMKGGKWNDLYCWYSRNFVCSLPKGQDPLTTPAPTIPTGAECPGFPDWIHRSPYCYYFSDGTDGQKDWYDAEEFCHQKNAHLVSIHDRDERNFINARLPFLAGNYWSGLRSNLSHPGAHKWSDQTLLDYEYWQLGQPDTQNGEELCVQLKGSTFNPFTTGRWLDANCGLTARFICKKNVDDTPVVTHPPTDPPTGGCPDKWRKHKDNRCYRIMGLGGAGDPKLNWQDAKQACINLGGYLASIHNDDVQTYLTADMYEAKDDVWIGMSSLASTNNRFLWTDSSSVDYLKWGFNQPDYIFQGNDTDCVRMVYEEEESGYWNDGQCDAVHAYVCKMSPDDGNPDNPPTPSCTGLPNQGYSQFGDSCFKLYTDSRKTFDEAKTLCENDGATVASILNGFEQAKLQSMMLESDAVENFWIGLKDDPTSKIFSWIDGWPLHYTNWGWSDPKGFDCVFMKEKDWFYQAGEWSNVNCNGKYYTACKYSTATPPTPIPTVDGYCPDGWADSGSSCYIMGSGIFATGTFGDAVYDCDKNYGGAHVATISNKAENSFVLGVANKAFGVNWVLIGIERSSSGGWEWVDGSPMAYTNWADGEPHDNNDNCGEMYSDTQGKWFEVGCKVQSHYVCEKPKTPLVTTQPPFVLVDCDVGADEGWKMLGDNCYYPSTDLLSWHDAEAWCNQNGGYLVSIHGLPEQRYVKELTPFSYSGYWIGYTKLYDEGSGDDYRWTDMSIPDYELWAGGQPDDKHNAQKCVKMGYDGTWEDYNCGATERFVCKRPKGLAVPVTKAPPPPAVGNCPQGWNKIGEGCYQLKAGSADTMTWEDARAECQKETRGDLASIHDQGVQSLLTSLLKSSTGNMWIGLRRGTSTWLGYHWVDQSNVDYQHWAKNEPSHFYDNGACVVMVNDADYPGRWDDIVCSQKHGYLCYKPLDPALTTSAPPGGDCPVDGYLPYFDECFKISETPMTFSDAKKACEDDQAALATVIDGFSEAFIVANMLYSSNVTLDAAWIGLTMNNRTGSFTWLDQWPLTYTNWVWYEPNGNGNCAIVNSYAFWEDTPCKNKYPFICRTTSNTFVPPTVPPFFPGTCPKDWMAYGDSCYMFDTGNSYVSWFEATYRCDKDYDNSRLLTIHSKAENAFVKENMQNTFAWDAVWLDLTRNETAVNQYEFLWNDGHALDYTNWKPGEPRTEAYSDNCVAMMPNGYGKWKTDYCGTSYSFACKKPKEPAPVGGCEKNWFRMDNWCFAAFGADEPKSKTWLDAEKDCNDKGGNLATVYSQNVQSLLEAMMFELRRTSGWIGLNKRSTGFFEWADGSPYNFHNWADGNPDANEDYQCVIMENDPLAPGAWKNGPCGDGRKGPREGYFCQTPTDPALEPYPTGDTCSQDGYFRYDFICYKVYSQSNQRKTFDDAEAQCQQDGAHLPSIPNGFHEAFTETLLYYYGIKDAWIGLKKDAQGNYTWINGDSHQYEHWGENEPSTGANDGCVRISNGHIWDAVPCATTHSFICAVFEIPPSPVPTTGNQTAGPKPTPNPQTGGLSGGAIAGIVIGVLAAVILALGLGYFLLMRNRQVKRPLEDPGPAAATAAGFDNVMYTPSADDVTFDSKTGMSDA